MKIATKIFIYTMLIMTIAFNIGITINISLNFQNSQSFFEEQALSEYYTKLYYLQNEFITANSKGEKINQEIAENAILEISNGKTNVENAVICKKTGEIIYNDFSNAIFSENSISDIYIKNIISDTIALERKDNLVVISSEFIVADEEIIFVQGFDTSHIISERDRQIRVSLISNLIIITMTAVALYYLTKHITKPILHLMNATNEIASGNYHKRILEKGDDEISMLSKNYNIMSDCIEESIVKLEDYAKTRDDFVRNFSHELKTPLTSIIGYADILRSKKCDEEKVTTLSNYIFTEGQRLEILSKQMIYLMKIKQENFEFSNCDVHDIINKTLFSVRPLASKKNVNIKYQQNNSYKILCNKELVTSMMINLSTNAINASDPKSEINIDVKKMGTDIILSVQDNGIGMCQEEISKITNEFYMIDSAREGTGTGIGLSICAEIVKLHNSKLEFESEKDVGTTVIVRLLGGGD